MSLLRWQVILWGCWGDKLGQSFHSLQLQQDIQKHNVLQIKIFRMTFATWSLNKKLLPSTIQVLALILLFSFWQSAQVICAGVRKIYWYCPFSSNPALIKVLLKTYQFCQKFWINLAGKKRSCVLPPKKCLICENALIRVCPYFLSLCVHTLSKCILYI